MSESVDYETVKEAVLKTVEMDPGVYRRRFRDIRKMCGQTHLEVARECRMRFDRWCKSEEVKTVDDIRQLVLLEHFKNLVHPEIKYEISKNRVKNLMDAARLADQLAVVHKMYKEEVSHKQGGVRLNRSQNYDKNHKYLNYSNVKQPSPNYSKRGPPNQVSQNTVGIDHKDKHNINIQDLSPTGENTIKCFACGEIGHAKYLCQSGPKSAALTVAERPRNICNVRGNDYCVSNPKSVNFEPFITEGKVGIKCSPEKKIIIFRDSGANQSLILKNVLELTDESYSGEEVKLRGFGSGMTVPLHNVNLESGFVSGIVKVGVSVELPVPGVQMLLGNDLAGDTVVPEPIMCENPFDEEATVEVNHVVKNEDVLDDSKKCTV
ncbi:uncharacterized protein LOC121853846 [Homarus americanus]|uniref:uncharacterized protein LOC121853846 n=1 Tax=Homarus americanus TaxID=6706 RepID=UPI001C475485|nr:uncharacterized protein LOC121853846 [Homarus americanus]